MTDPEGNLCTPSTCNPDPGDSGASCVKTCCVTDFRNEGDEDDVLNTCANCNACDAPQDIANGCCIDNTGIDCDALGAKCCKFKTTGSEASRYVCIPKDAPCTEDSGTLPVEPCRIFISSATYMSDFGNNAGQAINNADNACEELATAAGITSTTGFQAILQSSARDPSTDFSTCSAGYFLVDTDGMANLTLKVAENRDDLFNQTTNLENRLNQNENGATVGASGVWTGIPPPNSNLNDNCVDWTTQGSDLIFAFVGSPNLLTAGWSSQFTPVACIFALRIYCAEQNE